MGKRCFVIMPFSSTTNKHSQRYWTGFFEHLIKPSVKKLGYSCTRSRALPSNIIENILTDLQDADLVLAVLTDYNANVWYELATRHSLRLGTIMIIEKGQKIPSDLLNYGVIEYEYIPAKVSNFQKNLKDFVQDIEKKQHIDNPVTRFLERETWAKLWALKSLYDVCNITQKQILCIPAGKIDNYGKLMKRECGSCCEIFEIIVRRMESLNNLGYFEKYPELGIKWLPFFKKMHEQLGIGGKENLSKLSMDKTRTMIKGLKDLTDKMLRDDFGWAHFLGKE